MTALATQRCLNHVDREAVARCLECTQFFCRECVSEYDDRLICAGCLKRLAEGSVAPRRSLPSVWPVGQMAGGFLFAWFLFYCVGRMLIGLPEEFHDDRLWKIKVLDAFKAQPGSDE
ncbi:MAG: rhomboid family protein [Chthoniobacter sp.]|jgi:hypothetical protein|nr:rhomboid family protein [Chthoniobacter sp.]